jgi:ubiquinone/menaquinone biosynthesis C-methylase UbiE
VVGIEPNADMRQEAIRTSASFPYASHIEYHEGFAHQTGLPDGCADIITCSQAFHWMEPTATLAEVARLLRPGGLFAAYDYDLPPAINWELDQLAQEVTMRLVSLVRERGLAPGVKMWPKDRHLHEMRESGHFRFTREILLHHVEQGDATRLLALIRSNAFSTQFQFTDQELGLDRLAHAAAQYPGSEPVPWYIGYRVRLAVK